MTKDEKYEYNQAYYKKHREEILKSRAKYRIENRDIIREKDRRSNRQRDPEKSKIYRDRVYVKKRSITNKAKDIPCADCGIKYPPYVMDFDHIEGKTFNLSQAITRKIESIEEEIKKCEVVCSNCHRERTHQRNLIAGNGGRKKKT